MRQLLIVLMLAVLGATGSAQVIESKSRSTHDRARFRTVRQKLRNVILTVDWRDRSLREVVNELRTTTGVNLVVSSELRDRLDEEVSLKLHRVQAFVVMGLLRDMYELGFVHRRGLIVVTTKEDMYKRAFVTRIYNVRAMLYTPPDFVAPKLTLNPGPNEEPEEHPEPEKNDPQETVDRVRRLTGEKTWDVDGSSIEVAGGLLVVRHSPEVQRRVLRLLLQLGL